MNGIESSNVRGQFQFANNFGRTAIENLRWGTPSMYEVSIGDLNRGYRNWMVNGYVGDRWKLTPACKSRSACATCWTRARMRCMTKERLPYDTDGNNFSPRFAIAWQVGRAGWRAPCTPPRLARSASHLSADPQQPAQRHLPDGARPEPGGPAWRINIGPNSRYSPTWISPDLATPYSHQYNAGLEHSLFAGAILRINYIGSRSFKLLNSYAMNRAEPVAGIPLTTATVDRRRPDSRYSDTKTMVNGGIAYYDAAQVLWDLPLRRGLLFSMGYTFSTAIDQGADFTATAANRDLTTFRSQWQWDSFGDRKGLSNFDSTHALVFNYAWDLPGLRNGAGWLRAVTRQWQVSGANMWKKGTPLTLFIGSDAPGFGNVDGSGGDRPNLLDPSILGATAAIPTGATNSSPRFALRSSRPGSAPAAWAAPRRTGPIWNWNAAVARQFRLPNEWSAQLRAENLQSLSAPVRRTQRNIRRCRSARSPTPTTDAFSGWLHLLF